MEIAVVNGDEAGTEAKVAARRERFREAVARLGQRGQSSDLLRMVLLPGALALLGGFAFMFLGWFGASHTHRQIEQIPYLISGGLIGLGLVILGTVLLGVAFFTAVMQRAQEESQAALGERVGALETQLQAVTSEAAVVVTANERRTNSRPRRRTTTTA